jgi:hypothetical protein
MVLLAFMRASAAGVVHHDDDVCIQSNHLSGKLLETLSVPSCIPALNDQVATFLVPVFPEPLEQGVVKAFMPVGDKSHSPNFARLLRARRERPVVVATPRNLMNSRRLIFAPEAQDKIWYRFMCKPEHKIAVNR